jgi:O-antigen/teichoic acid export membrane protein
MRKNLIWAGLLRIIVRGLGILKTVILARLLTPSQFGIFGIAFLILGILEMITETGVNVILIQENKKIDDYINTGWIVSIVRGITISILIIIFTPLIVTFFNSPESKNILYLTALIPLLRGFINPAVIQYQKNLEFGNEFKFRSVIVFVEVTASVIIALITKSENALVWGMACAVITELIMSFAIIKPRPKFKFDFAKLKNMINLGKWITGAKVFDYLFTHLDDIVVGKLLGAYSLGIYQQSYRITSLPVIEISESFQRVTFPHYSKMIENKESIKSTYLKTLIYTVCLVVPFALILYLFPTEIIMLVYGSDWLSAVPVIKVLAIFGVTKTLANSVFPILLAYKRQDLVMGLTLVGIIALAITIYPLTLKFGLVGAGISTIIGSLVMIPPAYYWARKVTNE